MEDSLYTTKKSTRLSNLSTISQFSTTFDITPNSNQLNTNFVQFQDQDSKTRFSYDFTDRKTQSNNVWKSNRPSKTNPTNIYEDLTETTKTNLNHVTQLFRDNQSDQLEIFLDQLKIVKKDSE